MELDLYSIGLIVYVIVMVWIILGSGFTFPELGKWSVETRDRLPRWTYWKEIVKAVLTWPWFNIRKLRDKYSA